jgi:hypothetical protein
MGWNHRGSRLGAWVLSVSLHSCGTFQGEVASLVWYLRAGDRNGRVRMAAGALFPPLHMPGSKSSRLPPICLPRVEYFRFTTPSVEGHKPRQHSSAWGPSAAQGREVARSSWCQACDFPARSQAKQTSRSDGWGLQPGHLHLFLQLVVWQSHDSWSFLSVSCVVSLIWFKTVSWLGSEQPGLFYFTLYISLFWHLLTLPLPGL